MRGGGTVKILCSRLGAGLATVAVIGGCQSRPEYPGGTAFTDSVLGRYTPGSRFGQELATEVDRSAIAEIDTTSSTAVVVRPLEVSRHGLTHVRVHGNVRRSQAAALSRPSNKYFFFARTRDSTQSPAAIIAEMDSLFGGNPAEGCAIGRFISEPDQVRYWEGPDGGGVALLTPHGRDASGQTRLIVYAAGLHVSDAVVGFRRRDCRDTSR
jgi:hypothetical protein